MSGNKILLDTNIILYFLNGDQTLLPIFEEKHVFISFVTEIELLGYTEFTSTERLQIKELLSAFTIIDINSEIKDNCIELRQTVHLKLPDAIIMATSRSMNIPLISADADFKKVKQSDFIYYEYE